MNWEDEGFIISKENLKRMLLFLMSLLLNMEKLVELFTVEIQERSKIIFK